MCISFESQKAPSPSLSKERVPSSNKLRTIEALGLALSMVAFSPRLRGACASDYCTDEKPIPLTQQNAPLDESVPPVVFTSKDFRIAINQAVTEELQRNKTNRSRSAEMEELAELVATKLSARISAQSKENPVSVPSNAWPVAKALHETEEHVTKAIGWNLNTLLSGVSSTIVVCTGAWFVSMFLFRRYPNEFEIKIADLRKNRDVGEDFGVEALFGRTEIDALLGKPKGLSSPILNIFLPARWSVMSAQTIAKFWPCFSFLRFREPTIFRALNSFMKVNASNKPAIKQSTRDAHGRLLAEVRTFDGDSHLERMNPLSDGEEVIMALTYERWSTRVNRALAIPTKDLCALLANPKRYVNDILERFEEATSVAAQQRIHSEFTGLMRKAEIAVGIKERVPTILKRYLAKDFPKTWTALEENSAALRPLLTLNTSDGIAFLVRYALELEKRDGSYGGPETEKKEALLKSYAPTAPIGLTREFGVLLPQEEIKLQQLWYQKPRLRERVKTAGAYILAAAKFLTRKRTWSELRPVPRPIREYQWFGELRLPDPNL